MQTLRQLASMKIHWLLITIALPLVLDGCFAPVVEGAKEAYDSSKQSSLLSAAQGGDAAAQFKLGNSYCCNVGGAVGKASVYDNDKATYWYCAAALQDYTPAQEKLARIYSGNLVTGARIIERAGASVTGKKINYAIALVWARRAVDAGAQDAVKLRDSLTKLATPEEREKSTALEQDWRSAPCHWGDVFGGKSS